MQAWRDPRLSWNFSEHGGIKDLNLPANQIWAPDITLYNEWVIEGGGGAAGGFSFILALN